jgi:hypothetical protein
LMEYASGQSTSDVEVTRRASSHAATSAGS